MTDEEPTVDTEFTQFEKVHTSEICRAPNPKTPHLIGTGLTPCIEASLCE